MDSDTREKISSTYVIDEETNTVICGHRVTHKDGETKEKTVYAVTSIHDFSNLSHRALLKLASMQAKIKRKNEMGDGAHIDGTREFTYTWTDADVDGVRKDADPVAAGLKNAAKMSIAQLEEFLERAKEIQAAKA